jgi:hypothetical protein
VFTTLTFACLVLTIIKAGSDASQTTPDP